MTVNDNERHWNHAIEMGDFEEARRIEASVAEPSLADSALTLIRIEDDQSARSLPYTGVSVSKYGDPSTENLE
ncbi:MAG TPA: hypothetical protein PK096_02930 [Candidatus Saccharibacteria bacterium]|nr:hypothetical protein [Candidatus Saccharibacteria bacterium]HRK94295.1 hypothetical protein [Candidatus Saccharibacteria bacterium]